MKKGSLCVCIVLSAMLAMTGCGKKGPSQLEVSREEGISSMKSEQYEEAVSSFEAAYALCDDKMPKTKTDIALYEAACYMAMEDYQGLKDICTRIIGLNDSAEAFYLRGVSCLKLGEEDAARSDFDRASELNSSDYEMFLNIYKQYEEISQSAIGDIYVQKALAIPNQDMDDYYMKGYIYYYLTDYTKALEELSVPVAEKHEKAMLLMGESYLALEDNAHARNIFQQYLDEFGATATAYNGLTLCDLADKAYDAAMTDVQNGLAADPDDEIKRELLYNEIIAYEMKLDFETAKIKAEAFVEAYPDDDAGQREYAFLSTR